MMIVMKRCITIIVITFTLLLILFLLFFFRKDSEVSDRKKVNFKYESSNNLDEIYIGNFNEHDVYYVGINNLYIDDTKLDDYIKSSNVDELKKLFNRYIYLRDGGTQAFYCDDDAICDESIKIIYCNTVDNNTNIYIGELKDEFSVKICSNKY